jgi:putative (di)nucleoside polyphosphate hydrolase
MDDTTFRACVGLLVINERGEALAIERSQPRGQWQLPQGGIELGESALDAAYRELEEETGLRAADVERVDELPVWLGYELPAEYRSSKTGRGQAQRWFLFRLAVPETAIALPPDGEAADWAWMSLPALIAGSIEFRRPIYEMLLASFAPHLAC